MAISYGEQERYILNHIRSRKLAKGRLVTNEYGSWVHLSETEYSDMLKGCIDDSLFGVLKEKGIILNNRNLKQSIHDYRRKCAYLFQGTSLHIVVPTLRCNLKCVYCHARARSSSGKGYDMDKETAKKTLDFIFQSPSGAITIEFQGGEPLLRFDLVKFMIERALELNKRHKKDLQFSVVTNMTTMTEEIFSYLKSRNVGICTSLDGPEKVHDKNRQGHSKVRRWCKKILKGYTLNAMLLATKYTLPYPDEVVEEYYSLGLPRMWIKPANRLAFAEDNWVAIGFSSDEYLKFWRKALDNIVARNLDRPFVENYTKIILRKILTKDCVNFTDLESPCGAAIAQLAYNYDGGIHTCDEGRLYDIFRIGTVEDRYSDIVASDSACTIVRASINDNPVCELCAYKPYCGLCPVCSYSETGNIISKLPDRRCKILIGMFDYVFEKLIEDAKVRKIFFSWIQDSQKGYQNI